MRKIALVNQKGGVGKTTTAIHLSTALSILGQRVLLIDLDPQSNATLGLGLRPKTPEETIYAVLTGDKKPSEVILPLRSNLDVIPASIDLAGAEMELSGMVGRELVLRDAMKELAGYDFVIIDSPPSMGILNVNGLTAASEVFIPIQCEFFALQGISLLMKTIQLIQKRLNPELKLTGVIPCMVDVRKGLTREVLAEIETYFAEKIFKTRIRNNVRLAEAPSHGQSVFDYAPESNGAADYMALAREVLGLPDEIPSPPEAAKADPPVPVVEPHPVQPSPAPVSGI